MENSDSQNTDSNDIIDVVTQQSSVSNNEISDIKECDQNSTEVMANSSEVSIPSTSNNTEVEETTGNDESTPRPASPTGSSSPHIDLFPFPRFKSRTKNRVFRRRAASHNDSSSSENQETEDDINRNSRSSDSHMLSANSHESISSNSDVEQSISDPEYTTVDSETSDLDFINRVGTASESICKKDLKQNWFSIPEIINRQMGYRSRMNGNVLFQQRYHGSLHAVQRLELMYKMQFHDGCVNSLGFNAEGSLLVSGSDDLRLIVWDWANGQRKTSFKTLHRNNIFQSKFLHLSGQSELQLVTSSRDGQVWLWQLTDAGLRGSRKLGTHRSAVHRLALMKEEPHVVLSCGEDALVMSHDVREKKPTKMIYVRDCSEKRDKVPLYTIQTHPLNCNEFLVSGYDPTVQIFDRRNITIDGEPLKKFQIKNSYLFGAHITCTVYNYNGSELLASYNGNDIYAFDTSVSDSDYVHRYRGHRNCATIKGVNYYGPRSEYVMSGSDCGNVFFWHKDSHQIVQWMLADRAAVNCMEPHPSMPIIATSGLDTDIKIWVPSREEPNPMKFLENAVTKNLLSLRKQSINVGSSDAQTLFTLWQYLRRGSLLDTDDEDEADGFNFLFTSNSSTDSEMS